MKLGVIVPQGWTGEYDGWETERAWDPHGGRCAAGGSARVRVDLALRSPPHRAAADRRDHVRVVHLSRALAALTERVRLGHVVICNGFRNPALTAKMASTMDAISGGRMELGIGAGWKRDEWNAYGYGFPETAGAAWRCSTTRSRSSAACSSRGRRPTRPTRERTTGSPMRATSRSRSRRTGCRSWSAATART